jgi:hypothetical protein
MHIPDISYHLIFCFLSLKELTCIAQCNKEFTRLVTESSFLNMFHFQGVLNINRQMQIQSASQSPLRSVIVNIKMDIYLDETMEFSHFNRLESLDLKIHWGKSI